MIDLFYPAPPRRRAVSRVHRIEPDVELDDLPKGKARKERPRLAYEREWHIRNRERRLAQMRARYQARKQEYIDKANRWKRENPEAFKAKKVRDNKRQNARRTLKRLQEKALEMAA